MGKCCSKKLGDSGEVCNNVILCMRIQFRESFARKAWLLKLTWKTVLKSCEKRVEIRLFSITNVISISIDSIHVSIDCVYLELGAY